MKKFAFTYHTLYGVKKLLEKQAQGELALIENRRQRCLAERGRLAQARERREQELREASAAGVHPPEIRIYAQYLEYLAEEIRSNEEALAGIEEEKKRCQEKLIVLMKEIKALDNLRDAQFQRYLLELQKEEELELSDFVNFQIIA